MNNVFSAPITPKSLEQLKFKRQKNDVYSNGKVSLTYTSGMVLINYPYPETWQKNIPPYQVVDLDILEHVVRNYDLLFNIPAEGQ